MIAERKSSRRFGAVDLARETKIGRQVLAFDDREVVELLRAAIAREGVKQLMRGVMVLSALASI